MEQKNTLSSNNMISNQNDDNKNNGSKTENTLIKVIIKKMK